MRVAIHTYGTRGDVQPYIALSLALKAAGHDVQLAGPAQYAPLASDRGVSYTSLPGDLLGLMETPDGKDAIAAGAGFSAGFKLLKQMRTLMETLLVSEWTSAQSFEPQVIVYHPKSLASLHIAERLGCHGVLASPLPVSTPTSAFPSPVFPFLSLGPFNRLSHQIVVKASHLLFATLIGRWRETHLQLARRPAHALRPLATFYAYSRYIIPVPPDWGADVHVTGGWFLDSPDWQMPPALKAFITSGEPPIYVGFGSMPGVEPEYLTEMITQALKLAGRRGLLATGGGAMMSAPESSAIFSLREAPHDRILPLTHAAVHHGGAGTTMASARAGIPSAICPFFGDQPFWARRMHDLGVSPEPLSKRRLTTDHLARLIDAMDAPQMRARAAILGDEMAKEDGTRTAVNLLERYFL